MEVVGISASGFLYNHCSCAACITIAIFEFFDELKEAAFLMDPWIVKLTLGR